MIVDLEKIMLNIEEKPSLAAKYVQQRGILQRMFKCLEGLGEIRYLNEDKIILNSTYDYVVNAIYNMLNTLCQDAQSKFNKISRKSGEGSADYWRGYLDAIKIVRYEIGDWRSD
jgi:hypothetical protein